MTGGTADAADALGQHAGDLQRLAVDRDGVAHVQAGGVAENGQRIAGVAVDLGKVAAGNGPFGVVQHGVPVGIEVDGGFRAVDPGRLCRAGHGAVGALHAGQGCNFVGHAGVEGIGVIHAVDGKIRREMAVHRGQKLVHDIQTGRKRQKQHDHQRKGTGHQEQVFPGTHGVVDAERGLHFQQAGLCRVGGVMRRCVCIAGDRCRRGHPRRLPGRGMGRDEHGDNAHHGTADLRHPSA